MILADYQLLEWAEKNVEPFDIDCINPASIDLKLGNKLREPMWYWKGQLWRLFWSLHRRNPERWPLWGKVITFDTYILKPGRFVLCHSLEWTEIPDDKVAVLFSKSSTGRIGIEHLHAGYGDCGFQGEWTWELVNIAPWPVKLIAGKRLMQLMLAQTSGKPNSLYAGRYQHQRGPTDAKKLPVV
jgi:deoxycytidine triphosphate deaminase